ncbi:hypothetical protein D3C71_2124230 [compost metagenome]
MLAVRSEHDAVQRTQRNLEQNDGDGDGCYCRRCGDMRFVIDEVRSNVEPGARSRDGSEDEDVPVTKHPRAVPLEMERSA